jgi:large subunit ribosomal protein L24
MQVKKGDTVKVTAGKDKGKTGKVIQAFPKLNKVVVEGVNIMKKHIRSRRAGDKGQKLEFAAPMESSKVILVCPKCAKPVRTGMRTVGLPEGKSRKVRVCKKCGEAVE